MAAVVVSERYCHAIRFARLFNGMQGNRDDEMKPFLAWEKRGDSTSRGRELA